MTTSDNKGEIDGLAKIVQNIMGSTREKIQERNLENTFQREIQHTQLEKGLRESVDDDVAPRNPGDLSKKTKAKHNYEFRLGVAKAIDGPMRSIAKKIDTILASSVRSDKNKYEKIALLLKILIINKNFQDPIVMN